MKLEWSLYLVVLIAFQAKVTLGDHKSKLLSVAECENPTPPKSKLDICEATFVTYNKADKKLLNGTVVIKKNSIMYLTFKAGVEVNGNVKNYKLFYKKLPCKNIITKIILTTIKVDCNEDTSEILTGNYHFEGFDINKIDHAMNIIPVREPGINHWYIHFYGNDGTYVCIILRVEISFVRH